MSTKSTLGDLFLDATREVIEKSRIKAQMLRLERIMETDKSRLTAVYAEIGKLYIDGTLDKNKSKVKYAMKEIQHLKLRLERAEERYEQLKEAHSVDECKEAFRAELSAKLKQAQDSTAITAYKAKKKAQDVFSGKTSINTANIKDKAVSVAGSFKFSKTVPAKKTTKTEYKEDSEEFSYLDLLAELEEEDITTENVESTVFAEVEEEIAESAVEAMTDDFSDDTESPDSFDF